MKKILIAILAIGVLAAVGYCRDASVLRTNEPVQGRPKNFFQEKQDLAGTVKETIDINNKIWEIQRKVIQQDPELKQLAEQIRALQEQLRTKLEERLTNNEEYQSLKKRREQIKVQYLRQSKKRIEKFSSPKTN